MEIAKVQQVWNEADVATDRNRSWLNIPYFGIDAAREYLGKDFTGDLSQSLHNILLRRPGIDGRRLTGLAIACGDMVGELSLFKSAAADYYEIDGVDVSEVSLERARQNAKAAGIKFNPLVADCNKIRLPESRYDLIVGHHAIHHIENLENLFSQVAGSLKPGGLFYCSEYIGPNYVQVPLMNRLFASLLVNLLVWPPSRRITDDNQRKLFIRNLPYNLVDPSEGVRSSEIIKTAANHLNILNLSLFGGLNYPAFERIGHHFTACLADARLAGRFIRLEKILTRAGLIKPLFCFMLAEKKK